MGILSRISGAAGALLLAFTATLAPQPAAAQPAPQELLVGKWRHFSSSQAIDGRQGPVRTSTTNGISEFTADGKWSLASPQTRSGGTYRWLGPDRMEQTIVESVHAVQVGMVSVKAVRVTPERLELVTVHTRAEMDRVMPPIQPGERRPNEIVLTSVFTRVKDQ